MKIRTLALAAAAAGALALPASAQTWIVGTGAQGSLSFSTGAALSKLMVAKAGLKFRSRALGGSSTVLPQVNDNKLHFSLNNALETRHVYMGEGTFTGHALKNTRIVGGIYPLRVVFAVANNSPIKTLRNAKGMRIPSEFTSQTTFIELTKAALASAGLEPSDFKGVPVSNYIKGGDLLARGKVDLALVGPGSGGSRKQHAQMRKVDGMRFIDIGSNLKAMRAVFAEAEPFVLEANPKIPGALHDTTVMDYPFYVTTNNKVPNEVIYRMTKTMHQNKPYLVKAFGIFGRWNPDAHMAAKHSTTPFHPGAVKYYKEVGIWKGGIEG